MPSRGDVISYLDMCRAEGVNLQRGMNYHLRPNYSVILMSLRAGAPYADRIEDEGRTLIYEGHDTPAGRGRLQPKQVDQPMSHPGGSLTQNGLFFEAAQRHKNNQTHREVVRVYEKIRPGVWVYNGFFDLQDAWQEVSGRRKVFKFKLQLMEQDFNQRGPSKNFELDQDRLIPSHVKLEVWKRDKGQCTKCGASDNLHFDHVIPFSRGGSSLVAENVQILCARHNLENMIESSKTSTN